MELFSVPPRVQIQFRQSLAHDLLVIIDLFWHAGHTEGLSDWINHIFGRLESQNNNTLHGVTSVLPYASGLRGYLTDRLSQDHAATDYAAMMQALERLEGAQIRDVAIHSILSNAQYLGLVDETADAPHTVEGLASLLATYEAYRCDNWQAIAPPLMPHEIAKMVLDPVALKHEFLAAFKYMWHEFFRDRARADLDQEWVAVNYHRSQNYLADLTTVFRVVTGRTLPTYLNNHLPGIRHVDMIPSCHLGAYILVATLDDKLWIGFNANYVPAGQEDEHLVPIAELYPALRALADESRLRIVNYLHQHGEQNVGDIADALNMNISTTSRHLTLMFRTGLLDMRRDGAMRYYKLNPQKLMDMSLSLQTLADDVSETVRVVP